MGPQVQLDFSFVFVMNSIAISYSIIILPVFCMGVKLPDGRTQIEVFENRVLRRICGPNERKNRRMEKNCTMRSFIICTLHQIQ
jgi:hypothetical protein